MNFVVTDEMVDLTVLVGAIFGILAAGFIVHGQVQRHRRRKGQTKGNNLRAKRKNPKAGKSR